MTRRARLLLAVLLVAVAVAGLAWRIVGKRQAAAAAAQPARAASAAAQPLDLAGADVARVRRGPLTATLPVSGGLKAVDSAVVKARLPGELRALAVREGDRVAAGQLIGRLDDTEPRLRLKQAQDQAAAAQAQLDIAERTLENNRALVAQGFISRNALDTAVSNAGAARATLAAARAAADLAAKSLRDAEVRSPIAGLVSQRFAHVGERVALDARLVEVVDLSRLELEASIAPEDVLGLRVGQTARLRVDGLAQPLAARVVRIAPATQAGTRAVLAYLRLDTPPPGLRQGLFARGDVLLEQRPALLVPAEALRNDQARPYVLTVVDGRARVRIPQLGTRGEAAFGEAGERPPEPAVEVREGLVEGDVVLRGSVGALRDGTPLRLPAATASATAAATSPVAPAALPAGPASAAAAR